MVEMGIELIFIKSINKEVEFINFDGKDYLIIDMNLYEEFFNLNKIYFYSQSVESIIAHSCKYLSERFLVCNNKEISKEYYAEYEIFKKNEKYSSFDHSFLRSITIFQLLFLIYHEFNHYKLNNNSNKHDYLTKCLDFYKDQLDFHIKDIPKKDMRSDIDSYSRMITEQIRLLSEQTGIDPKEELISEKALYSTQYDYMEEIDCDERSAYIVMALLMNIKLSDNYFIEIFSKEFSASRANLSSFILLALHYLRYHQRMKIFDSNLNKLSQNFMYTFKRAQTRISLFRKIITDQYFCADNKEGAHFIQDIFRDLNIKFQSEIDDLIDDYLMKR